MREVTVSRFVDAKPHEMERVLTPETVVACEGSFEVREVTEDADGTLVAAGRAGVELLLHFERHDDGVAYEQVEGPLERLETTITYAPKDHGTRLTARSSVAAAGLPRPTRGVETQGRAEAGAGGTGRDGHRVRPSGVVGPAPSAFATSRSRATTAGLPAVRRRDGVRAVDRVDRVRLLTAALVRCRTFRLVTA